MFGVNTGLVGGLSGCVSNLWDRFVSAIQTIVDTVKAKLVTLWQDNPVVAVVMGVVAVAGAILVVMFFPAVAGLFRAVGSGLIRVVTGLINIAMGLVNRLLGGVGRRISKTTVKSEYINPYTGGAF